MLHGCSYILCYPLPVLNFRDTLICSRYTFRCLYPTGITRCKTMSGWRNLRAARGWMLRRYSKKYHLDVIFFIIIIIIPLASTFDHGMRYNFYNFFVCSYTTFYFLALTLWIAVQLSYVKSRYSSGIIRNYELRSISVSHWS